MKSLFGSKENSAKEAGPGDLPEAQNVLAFSKLPLDKIVQILQDFPQARKLKDGSWEAGHHVRLELEEGKRLEGWLNELDHRQFRLEALARKWPGFFPFSIK